MKSLIKRKPAKDERERIILFGLIDLYLKEGRPIGSNTLKENGFDSFSSATIRNYFTKLEEEGLLKQQHSSGGRIPTSQALRLYATFHIDKSPLPASQSKELKSLFAKETREVATYLLQTVEKLSEITGCAAFLSAPRFDQDFILEIKLVPIGQNKLLSILLTDFGLIKTELLYTEKKLSLFSVKRMETYFNWRLTELDKPTLDRDEELLCEKLYKELMIRHIISHSHFSSEDLLQTGFSKLLKFADFNLATGLCLFENKAMLHSLLSQVNLSDKLSCWIGEDLSPFVPDATACSVIAIPYKINQTVCGSIGILGPTRLPYPELFGKLQVIADTISESLTKSVYKFKLSFRTPQPSSINYQTLLIDNQSSKETS